MKKAISSSAIIICSAWCCLLAMAADLPPVPPIPDKLKDIRVLKPDRTIPKDLAEFSGEWEGVWSSARYSRDIRHAKLIVYEVSAEKIKFLYGLGDNPFSGDRGSWRSYESEVAIWDDKPHFSFMVPMGWRVGFYLENGQIEGSEGAGSGAPVNHLEMKRIN